ncbi:MAG: DUF4126 domain-containing protein [Steroidobacteraceae bacterium]
MATADILLSIALGVALAAAVGLRVFLPLFALSVAASAGWVTLADSFAWLATPAALVMLGVATLIEIGAYYVPGIDNLLDLLATPAALAAGTIAAAAVITDLPPLLRWTTAIIAGGGAAAMTQGASSLLRAKSTATTGGLGNGVVATGELGGAALLSALALFAPMLALLLAVLVLVGAPWLIWRLWRGAMRRSRPAGSP